VKQATYVPVYTLHEMNQELRRPVPVIVCTGCAHPIPAPRGSAPIQCRDCGKKMQIVNIRPSGDNSRAT
jgi:LSD1 subclass zinc finger protein